MSKNISTLKKMWIGLAVLALLSPLGLILPARLKSGTAWGEWSAGELEKMLGYVPQNMKKLAEFWQAPMPDYAFKGWDKLGIGMQSLAYVVSAAVGIVVVVAIVMLLGKMATKD